MSIEKNMRIYLRTKKLTNSIFKNDKDKLSPIVINFLREAWKEVDFDIIFAEDNKILKTFYPKSAAACVIGKNILYKNRKKFLENPKATVVTLAHELAHLCDQEDKNHFIYKLSYIHPIPLGVLYLIIAIIMAIVSVPIWITIATFVIALAFLCPVPAHLRVRYEGRAYLTGTIARKLLGRKPDDNYIKNRLVKALTSWLYYKMVWRNKTALNIANFIANRTHSIIHSPPNSEAQGYERAIRAVINTLS